MSFVYEYDSANGQIASVSNTVSGITCSYQYDIMDRATNIAYRAADGSLIRSLDYAYDSAGMILKKRISNSEQGTPNTEVSYAYDSLDRLVHESRTAGVSPARSIGYSYDLAGNRLSKTEGNSKTTYTLGIGNRLASSSVASTTNSLFVSGSSSENIGTDDRWGELYVSNLTAGAAVVPSVSGNAFYATVPALAGQTNSIVAAIRDAAGNTSYVTKEYWVGTTTGGATSSSTYQYNAAGCLTNLNGTSLQWDERYRLTNASFVQYEYDVLGRRVSRTAGGSPAEVEQYVYNDNQVVADLGAAGNLLRTYVWGPGIDNLLSFTDHASGTTYYAIKDHQNSVLAFVNESGAIIESYEYDAYGNTTIFDASGSKISESAIGNRYMFQGREYDSATGLYYFRARWYDPETGRWLSKDPIGISGGLNLYEFCANNPVNLNDPKGLYQTTFGKDDGYSGTKGYWNVGGGGLHGSEGQGYFSDGKGNQISPETVYAQMKKDGYKDGTPIKLYVCYAGLPGGDAEKLAALAKATVLANTDIVKILHSSFLGLNFNYWEYGAGEWESVTPSCGDGELRN